MRTINWLIALIKLVIKSLFWLYRWLNRWLKRNWNKIVKTYMDFLIIHFYILACFIVASFICMDTTRWTWDELRQKGDMDAGFIAFRKLIRDYIRI